MNKDHVYKRRLLKLADFLDKLPKERFDYETWVGKDWGGKQNLSCGTTACALGWATTIPSLRKAGLCMKYCEINDTGYVSLKDRVSVEYNFRSYLREPMNASKKVFGLNETEHLYLFTPHSDMLERIDEDGECVFLYGITERGPDEYATPKEVAEHIRTFVKAKYDSNTNNSNNSNNSNKAVKTKGKR